MTHAETPPTSVQFNLMPLPYGYEALAPIVSEVTMRTHHDKHHAGYIKKLNAQLGDGMAGGQTLEEVVRIAARGGERQAFNNAGQAWNHGFFWQSMSPLRSMPGADLAAAINRDFNGPAKLGQMFVEKGKEQFGSGWVWLIARGSFLDVIATHDAGTPIIEDGVTPILTCDVWEHAYYLDYKQDRAVYLREWFENVVNWEFAGRQYAAACGEGESWCYGSQPR